MARAGPSRCIDIILKSSKKKFQMPMDDQDMPSAGETFRAWVFKELQELNDCSWRRAVVRSFDVP
jgi:hypothetical protein